MGSYCFLLSHNVQVADVLQRRDTSSRVLSGLELAFGDIGGDEVRRLQLEVSLLLYLDL